nr:hypothetical protein [Exilispira sp.]
TNIKNRTTVSDVDQQSEVIGMFLIEPQIYYGYVSEYLQNLIAGIKDVISGIDRRLTELKYQRKAEGDRDSY